MFITCPIGILLLNIKLVLTLLQSFAFFILNSRERKVCKFFIVIGKSFKYVRC